MTPQPILIIGAGGIGGVVGAHLSAFGENVMLVDTNSAHIEAIKQNGLRLVGTRTMHERPPALHPGDLEGRFSRIILAVKAKDTGHALDLVERHLAVNGWVLPLQNGLGMLEIARRLGKARVIGGVIAIGAYYDSPGVIGFTGTGETHIGEIDGRSSKRVAELVHILSCVQPTYATENVLGDAWGKLALGAAYAATALADADVLGLYDRADARAILTALVCEVAQTALAAGVKTQPADGIDPFAFLNRKGGDDAPLWAGQVAAWQQYTNKRTGIWRDLAIHSRPTEVPALLLPVIAIAEKANVATPRLRHLLDLMDEVETRRRPLGLDTFFLQSSATDGGP